VPVSAPMSVVALANGEFAVVTLRSDHLVRVMNEHGKLLRSFGNISDAVNDPSQLTVPALSASANSDPGYAAGYATGPPPAYAMDIGKLYSGAPGESWVRPARSPTPTKHCCAHTYPACCWSGCC